MFSLNGNVFGGKNTLGIGSVGGLWEELTGSSNKSNFTECPAGFFYQYSPTTNSGQCVAEAGGVNVEINGKQVNPDTPSGNQCPVGFNYVKRADGTGSCVAKANVTTSNNTWGTTTYKPGGDSYNPAGSTVCPKGTNWDPVKGQCGKGTCPAGTTYDKVNGTCNCPAGTTFDNAKGTCVKKTSGGGGGGGGSSFKPPSSGPSAAPESPVSQSGISPMAIAAILMGVGALGAVVYKVRKDRKKGMTSSGRY